MNGDPHPILPRRLAIPAEIDLSSPVGGFLLRGLNCVMSSCPPLGVDDLADAVRDSDPSRCTGPSLQDALGQAPGLPLIANDIAPRPPGGADAAVGNERT